MPTDTRTAPNATVSSSNGSSTRKAREKRPGHVISFRIQDDAEFEALQKLAEDDKRSPENMAHLIIHKHLREASGAVGTTNAVPAGSGVSL